MTPDVAAFLLALLDEQQLPVNHPHFADLALLIAKARTELVGIVDGDG